MSGNDFEANKFVSPQEVMNQACDVMLDGREPQSREDWMLVVNCWAFNFPTELADVETRLMCAIFDAPLDADTIQSIIHFQLGKRGVN